MADQTESIRRAMVQAINAEPGSREDLEQRYGEVWDTQQLQEHFFVLGFYAPFCVVKRKLDHTKGSFLLQHNPRFYHSFKSE